MKTVVQDATIKMNVNLTVHDKDGNERREVYMGDWIQLRSFLHSSSGEPNSTPDCLQIQFKFWKLM